MKRSLPLAAVLAVAAACGDAPLTPASDADQAPPSGLAPVTVLTNADAGEGSLRSAMEAASADPSISLITLPAAVTVALTEPLVFTGSQDLVIRGGVPPWTPPDWARWRMPWSSPGAVTSPSGTSRSRAHRAPGWW